MTIFVSASCVGERCYCGESAAHKVEEIVFHDDPSQNRHPLTAYICYNHFVQIMGPAAMQPPAPEPSVVDVVDVVETHLRKD